MGHFPPLSAQSPWHLGWFEDGAAILGREADVKAARLQRERKGVQPKGSKAGENELPVVSQS
jgi:hypothetical protein